MKIAIVTGGAQGIGKAISKYLLMLGAKVCIADVNKLQGEKTVKELVDAYGNNANFQQCDITSNDEVKNLMKATTETFGDVTIMVNNAGIMDEINISRVIAVNLEAQLQCTMIALEFMGLNNGGKGGTIIFTSSVVGLVQTGVMVMYSAAKHGLIRFVRSIALSPRVEDWGVRFNAVCPIKVETDLSRDEAMCKAVGDPVVRDQLLKELQTTFSVDLKRLRNTYQYLLLNIMVRLRLTPLLFKIILAAFELACDAKLTSNSTALVENGTTRPVNGNARIADDRTTPSYLSNRPNETDDRDSILVGNLISHSKDYAYIDDICEYAQRAILDVNDAKELFPLFKLKLDPCLPEFDIATANSKLWDYIYRGRDTSILLSYWAGRETDVPICTKWGCIVNSVSIYSKYEREPYKYYVKNVAGNNECSYVFNKLIQFFKWKKVGLIRYESNLMAEPVQVFMDELKRGNATIDADVLLTSDKASPDVIWEPLQDIRIFVSFTIGFDDFGRLLCKLYNLGYYGKHYVLLAVYMTDKYKEEWDAIDESQEFYGCSKANLMKVLEGTLGCSQIVTYILGMYNNHTHFSTKKTYDDMKSNVKPIERMGLRFYEPLIYDNVWAIALAINATIQEHGIENVKNYKHSDNKTKPLLDSLFKNLLRVEFQGISGRYYYKYTTNWTGVRQFDSYIGLFDSLGGLSNIGHFDKKTRKLVITQPDDVIWKSKGGSTPPDKETKQFERKRINKTALIVLSVFAAIGITLAMTYIVFAIVHRKHVMIKDEWPIMTCIIIVGCILLDGYVLIHLADIHTGVQPESSLGDLCKATTGLLIFGFTFFYGGIAVKLWGVYMIFGRRKTKVMKEGWLIFLFSLLIAVDVITIAVWFTVDPLHARTIELASSLDDETYVRTITVMIGCESVYKTYFLIAILCYKAIVLLLGGFIVWPALFMSMRKGFFHFSGFAISVFTSTLVSIVLVIVSFLIPREPNALFIITGCLIVFTTILTVLLIFIPKAIIIARGGDPLYQKLFSPISAAFGFLETIAGEGQMPGLGAVKSYRMPGVALAVGRIEPGGQTSVLCNAYHHHGKTDNAGIKSSNGPIDTYYESKNGSLNMK
ncbi:unnamed protein product [Owenia fusiformis]|uniref:G-protein coupled receptors family 3 profile domain-containing protein n=1 Tax=Owenia fusiformis TaxID=6347 RepID=A0A8S4N539_OWEFU|nr:unnamed protein product [Owenia fusiformis]